AVVSFLHQYVAGIRLPTAPTAGEAGYRRFVIAPRPGGGLSSASARHESPHGLIASEWHLHDGEFTLTALIPPGTEAEIRLPGADTVTVGPGTHTYTIDGCHEDG
ncbi:MAG: alpha-L-rhamnosidase, partial [Streptomyces sp.]|nr:alpha-L-rhamnosidase [Streptomyces sp.]NUS15985.1 alpha-L-rhamnosidase [Streptomyces sp.]